MPGVLPAFAAPFLCHPPLDLVVSRKADVQRLLPALSTYLGHGSVAATQVYISMTPDLLDEASRRFERYVEHNPSPDAGQHRKGGTSHA